MASDRSRPVDRPRFGYTGVAAQQGRVALDRDVNAERALRSARTEFDANAFVGPCGTPDDGYRISAPSLASSPPRNYNPFDVAIGKGVMYLGGQSVALPAACTYMTQPEWPNPVAYGSADYGTPQFELFYLDVVEVEVSSVEDPDLLDVALGGPDTTGRTKLLQRVRRIGFSETDHVADCTAAWAAAIKRFADQGLVFDRASMRLSPDATMQASFQQTLTTTNPCDPQTTGGYQGPENQLLRLRVTTIAGAPQLVWGYDNASAIYRVKSTADDKTLVLTSDPPDAFQYPAQGQWVEVLPAAAIYGAQYSGTIGATHCVAEPIGTMHTLAQPYGPIANDDSTNYLVLDAADPLLKNASTEPVFVRVWQNAQTISIGAGQASIELVESASGVAAATTGGVSTGVVANLAWRVAKTPAEGATWEIAVRPSTPQGIYPAEYLAAPQPASGPKRWVCPLAFVDWTIPTAAKVSDCRKTFLNLVNLTKRRPGSCMFSIDAVDVAGGAGLQAAIDRARDIVTADPQFTGEFTVCLGPGTFALPAPLRFDALHSGMTLEGCAGRTVLAATVGLDIDKLAAFADGLVALTSANGLTLRGLEFQPIETPFPAALLKAVGAVVGASNLNITALGSPRMAFGVRAVDSQQLTIEDCVFEFQSVRPDAGADLVGAGVFVQGACLDLKVEGCTFRSLIPATFNPLKAPQSANAPGVPPILLNGLEAALRGDRVTFNNLTQIKLDLTRPTDRQLASEAALASRADAASPPASSPPATALVIDATQLREQISLGAWETLIGMKSGSAPSAPAIATIGLFAADLGVAKLNIDERNCTLGDAAFRDNLCDGVGLGALIATATYNTLRLQDNICQNGVTGLWVAVTGAVTPLKTQGPKMYYPPALFFAEYQYAEALATTLAPPADPSPPRFRPLIFLRKRLTPSVGSLLVSGNDIQTLWSVPNEERPTAQSGPALLLALCNSNDFTKGGQIGSIANGEVTASVTGNKLRSGSGFEAPAALVTLPSQVLFTMIGNSIANAVDDSPRRSDFKPPALSLEINGLSGGVSAVGNSLNGASNLADLTRPFAAPLDSLHPLNADPS